LTWQNQKDIDLIQWILDGYANEFSTEDGLKSLVEVLRNNYYDTSQVYSTDEIDERFSALFDLVYPVGAIYMSVNTTSPATLFGGTWEQIEGRFLLASGDLKDSQDTTIASYTLGDTDGDKDAIVVTHNHKPYGETNFVETTVGVSVDSATRTASTDSSGVHYWKSSGTGTVDAHSVTADSGSSGTDKNMPPYLVVNVWKRVA